MADNKHPTGDTPDEDLPHAIVSVSQGMFKFHPQCFDNHLNLITPLHRNVTWAAIQNLLARFEAQPVAPMASSIDSANSHNGDDARCYLHEWDEVLGRHWEATQETEHLETALATSQTILTAVEGESTAVWVRLVDSDARVAGRILRRKPTLLSFYSIMLF